MDYPWYLLGAFFFVYAFLGWCLEVAYRALKTGKFVNRGLLSGPVCPGYGLAAVVILVALEPLGGSNIPAQLVGCVVLANIVSFFSGWFIQKLSGRSMDRFRNEHMMFSSMPGLLYTLICGGLAVLMLYFVQPFVYLLCQPIPPLVLKGLVIAGFVLLGCDTLSMMYVLRLTRREAPLAKDVSQRLHVAARFMGTRLYGWLRDRLYRAFPELAETKPADGEGFGRPKNRVFARGVGPVKLFWVFLICSLLGDWIETVYVYAVSGVLMSRTSLIYGTFSVVWGFGAMLLTAMLSGLSEKPDRIIFLAGALLGGFYEYMCSVFTELVFGTVFWDYSEMPLNIGGRTNVLFMIFWGILSVVWIKLLYPRLSALIECIPPVAGTILTWVLVVLMCADILISAAAMLRYTDRRAGTADQSAYGQFLDHQYPDDLVEWTWPNMRYTEGEDAGVTLGEQNEQK